VHIICVYRVSLFETFERDDQFSRNLVWTLFSCAAQKPDFLISCNLLNIIVANARTCDLETTIVSLLGPKMMRDASVQYVPVSLSI
jgi:hypothetical protein